MMERINMEASLDKFTKEHFWEEVTFESRGQALE